MLYEFEAYQLDTGRFELRKEGTAISVEPQVFSLIALLVENRERMVSKDEIYDSVWDGRFVSEAALSSRIRSARQAIGDDGKNQRLIRTVHGTGFRFVGEVKVVGEPSRNEKVPPIEIAESESISQMMDRPAIAVLPFVNLSGDPEQEYFSDAVSSDIIANLSKHRWLNVIARNTTFGYKGKHVDVRSLAKKLLVSYVVEGTVQKMGSRIRVNVQLINAATATHQWAEKYDRELEDVFAVQDEITETIVARLEPEIGYAERKKVERANSPNLHAWESYHLGVSHFFKFTAEGNLEAQRLLQQSRELDPHFGEAHAWWAYAVVLGMVYWDTEPDQELLDRALMATRTALSIDSQNAVFYALKARVQLARCEYKSAIVENEMAIRLNSTFAAAHCGLADSLAYEGDYEAAVIGFEKALELSPNDPQRWAFLTYGALALIFKGDYQKAIEWTERASEIPNCQYWTTAHRAVALAYLDRHDDAKRAVKNLLVENPKFSRVFAERKLFYLKRADQRETYLRGLELAGVPE